MNEPTADLETLRAALGKEARKGAGDHPGLESLIAYHRDELGEAADERLRDHLVGCRDCAARLLDLAPLLRPEAASADAVKELEIEAAWREIQGRIGPAAEPPGSDPRRPGVVALAASLAVVALALGLWAGRLHQVNSALRLRLAELSAPVANMPHLYLDGVTRGDRPPAEPFEVPATASHFGLFIAVPDPVPAEAYEARFVDASGEVVLEVRGLLMSDGGSLRLGLTRGGLPAGDYLVRVRGLSGGAWRPVAEHRLRLSYADRPTIALPAGGGRAD